MHYTCQLVLRLSSVCECFVFGMFTYLCVHFFAYVLAITSNLCCLLFLNTQSSTLLLCFSVFACLNTTHRMVRYSAGTTSLSLVLS